MLRFGLAVLVLCSSTWAEASAKPGKTQKVVYPNGRVVYEAVSEKPAPQEAAAAAKDAAPAEDPVAQADPPSKVVEAPVPPTDGASPVSLVQQPTPANPKLPCEGCGDGTTPTPDGKCEKHNPPYIIPGSDDDCEGKKVCTDKDNPQKGKLGEVNGGLVKFYKNCVNFQAVAPIPVIVKNQREDYIFDKAKYGEKCCEYIVCVVTKCCCIDTRECELRKKNVSMRACRRTVGGGIDVYVLNEPGFPEQWVLHLGLTTAEYQAEFPSKPIP
jgi:hypothetical protein